MILLKRLITEGYGDKRTQVRRISVMEAWLANRVLIKADKDAKSQNQVRVAPNTMAVTTSIRGFLNRLSQGSNVDLAATELAFVAAVLGKRPISAE